MAAMSAAIEPVRPDWSTVKDFSATRSKPEGGESVHPLLEATLNAKEVLVTPSTTNRTVA